MGVIGGLWAMIPDIDHFLEEPIFKDAAWNDIFIFHVSFDNVVPETDLFFAAEMLLVFAAVNLFALAICVESFKRLGEALFGKEEEKKEEEEKEGEEKEKKEVEEEKEEPEERFREGRPVKDEKIQDKKIEKRTSKDMENAEVEKKEEPKRL